MQGNRVYVIQVTQEGGTKGPLALPPPPETLLPSEVKYSASLVRGHAYAHLVLGFVLFLLGIFGLKVEPESGWSGAGVWSSLTTVTCGVSGLLAHRLWYKNWTIKGFLVTGVASVIITFLAFVLTVYAVIKRHEHHHYLLEQTKKHPWYQPYDPDEKEHTLTLSVSINLLVALVLEMILALWSSKVAWRGVRAEEFSANRRELALMDRQSILSSPSSPHNTPQVPLAALYQLLQTHPEVMNNKNIAGTLGGSWLTRLEERPSHLSMDYQERVSRFLSHAIEDQNISFSRSPSTLNSEPRDSASSPSSSSSSSTLEGGGRGALSEVVSEEIPSDKKQQKADLKSSRPRKEEQKVRAPAAPRHNPLPRANSKPTQEMRQTHETMKTETDKKDHVQVTSFSKSDVDSQKTCVKRNKKVDMKTPKERNNSETEMTEQKKTQNKTNKHKTKEVEKLTKITEELESDVSVIRTVEEKVTDDKRDETQCPGKSTIVKLESATISGRTKSPEEMSSGEKGLGSKATNVCNLQSETSSKSNVTSSKSNVTNSKSNVTNSKSNVTELCNDLNNKKDNEPKMNDNTCESNRQDENAATLQAEVKNKNAKSERDEDVNKPISTSADKMAEEPQAKTADIITVSHTNCIKTVTKSEGNEREEKEEVGEGLDQMVMGLKPPCEFQDQEDPSEPLKK